MYVLQMRPVEQVRVDQERLGILYDQLGETGAEDVVCRAMEELALRMSHCNRLYQASNCDLRDRPDQPGRHWRDVDAADPHRRPVADCNLGHA